MYWQVDYFNNGSPRTRYFSERWTQEEIKKQMKGYIVRSITCIYNTPTKTIMRTIIS